MVDLNGGSVRLTRHGVRCMRHEIVLHIGPTKPQVSSSCTSCAAGRSLTYLDGVCWVGSVCHDSSCASDSLVGFVPYNSLSCATYNNAQQQRTWMTHENVVISWKYVDSLEWTTESAQVSLLLAFTHTRKSWSKTPGKK